MKQPRLRRAIERFDLEAYIRRQFDPVVESGSTELRVDCFSPNGCAGSDNKQHLWINIEKKVWICYKCGYGNNHEQPGTSWLPVFIADAEGKTVAEVKRWLIDKVEPTPAEGLGELLEAQFQNQQREEEEPGVIVLPDEFFRMAKQYTSRAAQPFFKYTNSRGLKISHLREYDVRFCLSSQFKLWKGRVIFPIRDLEGNARSAVGRAISEKREVRWVVWPKSDVQKLMWPLGKMLAGGEWQSLRDLKPDRIVLTEGIADALGVIVVGGYFALCTFGKKISHEQLALLQELSPSEVVLAWDWEARKKMVTMVDRLRGRFDLVSVFPFSNPFWQTHDFGNLLQMDKSEAVDLIVPELVSRVQVDSGEFLVWVTRMKLS